MLADVLHVDASIQENPKIKVCEFITANKTWDVTLNFPSFASVLNASGSSRSHPCCGGGQYVFLRIDLEWRVFY